MSFPGSRPQLEILCAPLRPLRLCGEFFSRVLHRRDATSYTWRNLPLDVAHVLTYFVAHEGHHRGQIVMLARQLGHRLPVEVTGGLWHFAKRAKETRS